MSQTFWSTAGRLLRLPQWAFYCTGIGRWQTSRTKHKNKPVGARKLPNNGGKYIIYQDRGGNDESSYGTRKQNKKNNKDEKQTETKTGSRRKRSQKRVREVGVSGRSYLLPQIRATFCGLALLSITELLQLGCVAIRRSLKSSKPLGRSNTLQALESLTTTKDWKVHNASHGSGSKEGPS